MQYISVSDKLSTARKIECRCQAVGLCAGHSNISFVNAICEKEGDCSVNRCVEIPCFDDGTQLTVATKLQVMAAGRWMKTAWPKP